ncbi:MAG: acyl-CoA dehydrogenase [Alphaproteobacteria bacterium]
MADYRAPIEEMRFVLREVAGLDEVAALPGCGDATPELVDAALEEAGKLAAGVLAPLNRSGDRTGARLENGVVRTPDGFRDAYRAFVEGGWNGVPFDPEFGGQGLPWLVSSALNEMWSSANLSLSLCPLLTQGAIDLLTEHGSAEQKATYLAKMISGEWTGTMNLTEPQAGSDVGALRTRAMRDGDRYRITGQKIFITYGEHDFTDNIVHMVLARTPDAPSGVKGISLFIVPKYLPEPDGTPGERNDLRVASIEHKLGIHASPTCVMAYGDDGGAVGFLIGEECRGIEYMFTMMNNARLGVGLQGVAIAERALQQARAFAGERTQGRDPGGRGEGPVPIVRHPDVRRMLLDMRARTEAVRALAYYAAAALDRARREPDAERRRAVQARVDLLIPIVKAWSTDTGVEVASTGVQIHGGMGFIEETGAAQHYRDARIAPIYEGTNGIQALDLFGRKLLRDRGAAMRDLIAEMRAIDGDLAASPGDDVAAVRRSLAAGIDALEAATDGLLAAAGEDPIAASVGATAYLRLTGTVVGGWLMARGALAANRRLAEGDGDPAFLEAKLVTARFYAEQVLPTGTALLGPIVAGGRTVMALAEEQI